MKQRIFAVSDLEMGKSDVMDDFSDDKGLYEFITGLKKYSEDKITLILNGDIFDFLKMAYKETYPRYVTEEISLWKLGQIFEHHPAFFKGLTEFLEMPNAEVYFLIGNHDFDLVWPRVQEKIKKVVGFEKRIFFQYHYQGKEVHMEHGHSLDPFFSVDEKNPIISYKGQKILNLPLGSQIAFAELAPFKRKFPKLEKLFPKKEVFKKYPFYNKEINKMMRRFMWKGLLVDPILHFRDPTYNIPYKNIVVHFFYHGLDFISDEKFLTRRIKKLSKRHKGKKLFVLGHSHVLTDLLYKGIRFMITDTWRDEYHLLSEGRRKKDRSYVEVYLENDHLVSSVMKIFVPKD